MMFVTTFTTAVILIYCYVGWRVIAPAPVKPAWKVFLWASLLGFPLLLPLSFITWRLPRIPWWGEVSSWAGYTWLGFMAMLFTLLASRDALWTLVSFFHRLASRLRPTDTALTQAPQDAPDPARRDFLLQSMNAGLVGASFLFTSQGLYESVRLPDVTEVPIFVKGLPPDFEGFRIAQISDMHVGATIKRDFVEGVVRIVNGLGAQVIALTGDLVDGSVPSLAHDVEPLADLHAPQGNYFVTGNHEYYSGVLPWIAEVERLGFQVLINEHRILREGRGTLVLAGVTDITGGRFLPSHASSPAAAVAGAPPSDVRILLAHQPRSIFSAARTGYDLQISGHTHGGQFMPWNLVVELVQPYTKGLHWHEGTLIYVNRGAGYWGPPLRLGIPSEITLFKLTRSPGAQAESFHDIAPPNVA